jgi:SMC interacting uncharacterized protein involved in chromosome segregation
VNDPQRLDIGDWALTVLAGIFIGIVSGLGTAMAWFRGSKNRIYERIDAIEANASKQKDKLGEEIRDIWKNHNEHEAQLRVMSNCQANILQSLQRMEKATEKQDEKLDELVQNQRRG